MDNKVLEVIRKRSSARSYGSEGLSEEELRTVIEAGLHAPTGMNKQELRFSVVSGDNPLLKELDADKRALRGQGELPVTFYYDAPTLIFISAETGFKWSSVDAGIAVQTMALAAESIGLNSLIIGCVYDALNGERKAYYDEKLGIPEGYSFAIALAVGHRTDEKAPHEYDYEKQVHFVG